MMKIRSLVAVLACLGMSFSAIADDASGAFVSVPGKAALLRHQTVTGQVTAVDPATRVVKIKPTNGEEREIVAGNEVRNFAQIKVGDKVSVEAIQALTLELKKGGAGIRERVDAVDAQRAQEGEKPAGAVGAKVTVLADVTKVDKKKSTIDLRGVHHSLTLKISDPNQLNLIAVGDQVRGTYVEAVGVAVTPATGSTQ
ncbi:hypothetical protein [Niveibacterium microcysteis]|uniref:DUF5666 domain-containing protein n=1 Tax=Niveibacterium microcysteis TaxID=2811415 RepID=A0ABX7M5D6_9RHOO|nr:hypothetical protein [Niveibacterium microcysteis]QSI76634.1 hypothetical protein JY500_19585 [Niveibacterium microcysteis]